MTRVGSIAKREVTALFQSPIAYVVMILFLFVMGALFSLTSFQAGNLSDVRLFFRWARFCLFFIVPMLTMGLMAEEQKSGRMEMLRTSPITELSLLLGKYAGAMVFYLVLLASTLIYIVLLTIFGRPDFGVVAAEYLGMILLGMLFVSIGLFFSTVTREQTVAAMATFLVLGLLTFFDSLASAIAPVTIGGQVAGGGGGAGAGAGTDWIMVGGTVAELYAAGVILGLAWAKTGAQRVKALIVPIISIVVIFGLYYLITWIFAAQSIPVRAPLVYVAIGPHLEDFFKGVVETSQVIYFLSGSFLFLFFAYLVTESRKWR